MTEYRTIPRPPRPDRSAGVPVRPPQGGQQNRQQPSLQPPESRSPRALWIFILVLLITIVGLNLWWLQRNDDADTSKKTGNQTANESRAAFDKTQFSTSDPASPWVVVNKKHPLSPTSYAPAELVTPNIPLRQSKGGEEMQVSSVAAPALEKMVADAKKRGASLMLASGYRSYGLQVKVYGNEVKAYGQAAADQESARPGYSEHQTGLAVDLEPTDRSCEIEACFADTPEGKWLAAHAHEYGFIIRYTPDKVAVTGYKYEPWHVRYVGEALAAELHRTGVETLEEFFSIAGGDY